MLEARTRRIVHAGVTGTLASCSRSLGQRGAVVLALCLGAAGLTIAAVPAAFAASPANDELSAATTIVYESTAQTTTAEATTAPVEPDNSCAPLAHSVWFTFTTGADPAVVSVATDSDNPARDTVIAVYSSSTEPATYGSLSEVVDVRSSP